LPGAGNRRTQTCRVKLPTPPSPDSADKRTPAANATAPNKLGTDPRPETTDQVRRPCAGKMRP